MKKTVIALYIVVIVVMAIATIVEKYEGTPYVSDHLYGAWWFSGLWALLTAAAVFCFIKRRVRRPSVVALHLSFVLILAGALLTHLTATQGAIHLRTGQSTTLYITADQQKHTLPFSITLNRFELKYHEGTQAPADYLSHITLGNGEKATVSMNNIVSHHGVRLYQSSYDDDMQGSMLAVNSDPWGIPVTYAGYALFFVSLVWILIDPKGTYRQLLRKAALTACLLFFTAPSSPLHATFPSVDSQHAAAPRVLPQETAERFGRLFVVYNDRVCPIETYALDFTKKLCGKRHYGDYNATQVLTGFVFYYDDWIKEPIIKVKGSDMKQRLSLPDNASFVTFFNRDGYVLGPFLQDKDVRKLDDKLSIIMQLHQGQTLKLFPYADKGRITWYAPTETLPDSMDAEHRKYIREVFTLLNGEVHAGNFDRANQFLDKMLEYQQTFGARSIPSATRVWAEHIYNAIPFATLLFMVCLTLGIVAFIAQMFCPGAADSKNILYKAQYGLLLLCLLTLAVCLALRWVITGTIPMSNGYETMLFMAWAAMLLALCSSRRFAIMLPFGFLLSGFCLLVSHLSQMDPQMTHLMPVLNSPLLTIHVSVIMMAYALLGLTFMCSLTALAMRRKAHELHLLSQLLLFPAMACLGFGIFIGAIWANVSWGTYWSWDPKETWALITFMVYAAPLHRSFSPLKPNPSHTVYHVYMTLAFLTLLMTYFGVNFFLGGMHSYA